MDQYYQYKYQYFSLSHTHTHAHTHCVLSVLAVLSYTAQSDGLGTETQHDENH